MIYMLLDFCTDECNLSGVAATSGESVALLGVKMLQAAVLIVFQIPSSAQAEFQSSSQHVGGYQQSCL